MNKFRLHRIMEVKRKVIEEKEGELHSAAQELAALNLTIEALSKDIKESYTGFAAPSLSGQDFSVIKDYLAYLERKKLDLFEEREGLHERMDALKAELVELFKELKMLETLESKLVKAIKKSENRREQKNLDEMALRLDVRRL